MIETRPARFQDALRLAPRLRLEDAGELRATWDVGPGEGLCLCLLQSDRAFALVEAGQVIGLWGVRGVSHAGLDLGIPWLLAAERLFENRREVVRHSRSWVDRLLLEFDVLTNLTLASNATHLRWLAWCGFRILRIHRRHGRAGVAFCEFYKVNTARRRDSAGVRESLLARRAGGRPGADGLLSCAAGFAARGYPTEELASLVAALQSRHARGRALSPAVGGLLAEAAAAVLGRGAASELVAEWCGRLLALRETALLDGDLNPGRLALILDVADRPAVAGAVPRGLGGLAMLVRRYVANLTLGGRIDRLSGRRLRLAALGVSEESLRQPLGVPLERVVLEWSRRRAFASVVDGDPVPLAVMTRRESMEALAAAATGEDRVGRCLAAALQAWGAVGLGPGPANRCGRGWLAGAAARVADHVSRQLLPSVRLGGVVSGFADRQHLYWLLRARLLISGDPAAGHAELAADVGALLVAARAEDRLICTKRRTFVEDDLAAVIEAIAEVFGAQSVRRKGDLGALLGVLGPALAVPSVHVAQLTPALLAWRLVEQGGLEDALEEVGRLLPDEPLGSRAGYRKLLRRLERRTAAMAAPRSGMAAAERVASSGRGHG